MLIRTAQGVQVMKDWDPARIGRAFLNRRKEPGEGMVFIQALLLHEQPKPRPEPRPIPVQENVEALARFLRS